MPKLQQDLMFTLYGTDVWKGFEPVKVEDEVQGWNGNHPSLSRLVSTPGSQIVIDVGVWKGMSTITMASEMKRKGLDGCVICVDTFLGSPEHWSPGSELFERRNGMPDLYQTFMSNVHAAGVVDYVIPMPQTSTTAASILRRLGIKASVIHIDAAHEYEEVIRDAQEFWTVLEPGGFLIGDDYHWTWPGVVKGAAAFSLQEGVALSIEPPKWIVQKPL